MFITFRAENEDNPTVFFVKFNLLGEMKITHLVNDKYIQRSSRDLIYHLIHELEAL